MSEEEKLEENPGCFKQVDDSLGSCLTSVKGCISTAIVIGIIGAIVGAIWEGCKSVFN